MKKHVMGRKVKTESEAIRQVTEYHFNLPMYSRDGWRAVITETVASCGCSSSYGVQYWNTDMIAGTLVKNIDRTTSRFVQFLHE